MDARKIWYIIICLVFVSCASLKTQNKQEFSITFFNDTDKLMCYSLEWIDHPFDYYGRVSMAGGELKPGKENRLDNTYPYGTWVIRWYQCREYDTNITRKVIINKSTVLSTPKKETIK